MIEAYRLDGDTFPTLPTPHDCVITRIQQVGQHIVFYFENDISSHDSISAIRPRARSLILRYHLVECGEYAVYKWHRGFPFFSPSGFYKPITKPDLNKLTTSRLEYLYHNIRHCSIITTLCADNSFLILDADVDYVEYEWIE